jgi:hypothetical protein
LSIFVKIFKSTISSWLRWSCWRHHQSGASCRQPHDARAPAVPHRNSVHGQNRTGTGEIHRGTEISKDCPQGRRDLRARMHATHRSLPSRIAESLPFPLGSIKRPPGPYRGTIKEHLYRAGAAAPRGHDRNRPTLPRHRKRPGALLRRRRHAEGLACSTAMR